MSTLLIHTSVHVNPFRHSTLGFPSCSRNPRLEHRATDLYSRPSQLWHIWRRLGLSLVDVNKRMPQMSTHYWFIIFNRYCIMENLADKVYVGVNTPAQLWPDLLYLYHTVNERTPSAMVQGTFIQCSQQFNQFNSAPSTWIELIVSEKIIKELNWMNWIDRIIDNPCHYPCT